MVLARGSRLAASTRNTLTIQVASSSPSAPPASARTSGLARELTRDVPIARRRARAEWPARADAPDRRRAAGWRRSRRRSAARGRPRRAEPAAAFGCCRRPFHSTSGRRCRGCGRTRPRASGPARASRVVARSSVTPFFEPRVRCEEVVASRRRDPADAASGTKKSRVSVGEALRHDANHYVGLAVEDRRGVPSTDGSRLKRRDQNL